MNNSFPIMFIINQWIKPAAFGSERVYFTTILPEENASTLTIPQKTLSLSFQNKIFEPVSLPGDSLNIRTRERHTRLNATFDTAVNHAWNATAQEMFPSSIILFRIEFITFQEKLLPKHLSFFIFNRARPRT